MYVCVYLQNYVHTSMEFRTVDKGWSHFIPQQGCEISKGEREWLAETAKEDSWFQFSDLHFPGKVKLFHWLAEFLLSNAPWFLDWKLAMNLSVPHPFPAIFMHVTELKLWTPLFKEHLDLFWSFCTCGPQIIEWHRNLLLLFLK